MNTGWGILIVLYVSAFVSVSVALHCRKKVGCLAQRHVGLSVCLVSVTGILGSAGTYALVPPQDFVGNVPSMSRGSRAT